MSSESPTAPGSMSEAQSPALIGQVLDGRYRITRKLGEGGMGEVFAAEHVHIEKRFAIKLLRPEIVSNPEAVTRFRQEARSSSSIGHRNIIAVEDFGQLSDGRIYMCMELLNGAALNDMLTQPLPVDRLLNILIQTGHGLAAAHAKGIVHRDMKPENVFVTIGPNGEDVPKILDFGIAKVAGNDGQNHLTRTGTIFGTPFYMAPEQALGNPVDARTDIYAMGVIMYECFAGSLPFQGESFMGILTQHITMDPEPVAQRAAAAGRHLPPGLGDVIMRCMQKNPQQRFSTMDELVNILIQIYRGIVGPGMSTYMEAFPIAPTAGHQVQHTPPPRTGPFMAGGPQSAPMAAPSGPAPMVSAASSGMYGTGATPIVKKSKIGLIVAVLAVLAVGGGIAAFVIVNNDNKPGKGSGSQVAINDGSGKEAGPGSSHVGDPVDAAVVVVAVDAAGTMVVNPPVLDAAGGATPAGEVDAGADVEHPSGGSNTLPPLEVVQVPLFARNVGAFEVYENGTKVLDGPDNLEVHKGEKRTVVIKAKGFKDKTVVVEGAKKKVQFSLERIPSTTTTTHIPPPPPALNCADALIDASNDACRKQFCAGHRDQPKCMTE
ncbi:MAG: serine/threonine-protein kinase [Kofleriaceae bacterium]